MNAGVITDGLNEFVLAPLIIWEESGADKTAQRLTLHECPQLASCYEVWQFAVHVQRCWRCDYGICASVHVKTN